MGVKAHGRIVAWQGASLWIFGAPAGSRYPKTALHSHHGLQLTFALTGRVDFDGARDGVRIGGEAVAVAPDAPHRFEGTGLVAHLFVEPDGQAGRKIVQRLCAKRSIEPIPANLIPEARAQLRTTFENPRCRDEDLKAVAERVITQLANQNPRSAPVDPRISKVLAWAADRLDQSISLGDVAALVRLSEGRMRHLFVEQTGLSLRTYLLWLRLARAVELFGGGASLTEAAHGAGFSDSAHLSRTFRRMFGIKAATLSVS